LSARALVARVEDEIIDRFDLDLLPIISASSGQKPILDENNAYMDRWGVERKLPVGGGHYYVSKPPLANVERISDLDSIPWPEPKEDFSELTKIAKNLYENTDKALVLNLEIGFLHQAQFMRGFDTWLLDLAAEPKLVGAYMDRMIDIWLVETENAIKAVNDYAHIATYTDDIAFQDRPMMSRRMLEKLIFPRQKRVIEKIKESNLKVMYHSCGSLVTLFDDYIEMGVDIINPVQVSAAGMNETAELKNRWGKDLVFWGGVDTQDVLPHGTVEDVRAEVIKRLDDLSPGGGFMLACVHDIQEEVPAENIRAVFETAMDWSKS
ncbi:MAG: hypothetical protein JEZ06_22640, partial [Anaerolineaceae bacterium]|nr:hypothetical protein [Anaerolineaceae bacterium]